MIKTYIKGVGLISDNIYTIIIIPINIQVDYVSTTTYVTIHN